MATKEQQRLDALRALDVLDTPAQEPFDRVVKLAATLFNVPIALVSLIDQDRQWFKARIGVDACETPREWAFCSHAIELDRDAILVVPDATLDPRFCDNPLVTGAPDIRFYAGAVLTDAQGHNLGTLCIIDTVARPTPDKPALDQLRMLADIVMDELALHRASALVTEKSHMLDMAEQMSGIGHWRYDVAAKKVTWSDEVYRIFGVDRASFDPSIDSAVAFYPPGTQEAAFARFNNAVETGQGYQAEQQLIRKDGELRDVVSRATCEIGANGAVKTMFGVFQDVTEHSKALKAANAAVAVKSEFLANMSHELRTPLTSIIGFSELLRSQPGLSEKSLQFVERVIHGGQALLSTVNDVLDFSKLEAGQIELNPQPVIVRDAFHNALELFAPQASANKVRLALDIQQDTPASVLIDQDRLRQVLLNLVGNAIKFTSAGSVRLAVGYDLAGQTLRFSVTDTGIGIKPEKIQQLFQRFSQVDGSNSRSYGGSGLGLAICRGLVEAMGGEIGAESIYNAGSTFTVRIPCEPVLAESLTAPVAQFDFRDIRVLAADDDEGNCALLAAILKNTGIELTLAKDGMAALRSANAAPVDLILMDLHMPVMDGQAACAAIRDGNGPNAGVPILAFTAGSDQVQEEELLRGGFDGVVCKPVARLALLQSISDALDGSLQEIPKPPTARAAHA